MTKIENMPGKSQRGASAGAGALCALLLSGCGGATGASDPVESDVTTDAVENDGAPDANGPLVELLEQPEGFSNCFPSAANASGSMVVGGCGGNVANRSLLWVRGKPLTFLEVEGYTQATSVTADGSMIGGFIDGFGGQGYLYDTEVRARLPIGVTALSEDGSIMVGSAFERSDGATTYSVRGRFDQGDLQRLAPVEPGLATMAYSLSGDGRVAVGSVTDAGGKSRAAFWSEDGELHLLDELSPELVSLASAVNRDGSVIVGTAYSEADLYVSYPVRWTAAGIERLGTDTGGAVDVSADGRRIIVQFGAPDLSNGLWEAGSVARIDALFSPQDFGRSNDGLSMSYDLGAWGITSDGRSIFGTTRVDDAERAFIARLPR